MNKKIIIPLVIAGIITIMVAAGSSYRNKNTYDSAPVMANNSKNQTAKEFIMESFVEMVDGKPKPQYSTKEITVNKGDLVRIKITMTKGVHDFKIDEFDVYADTPLNQEVVVEFTADKTGEFIYYCTKPGHRQNGHWGTLKVTE